MKEFDSVISGWLLGLVCGVLCVNVGAQDIYKWIDANGKVHYGDRAAAPENSAAVHVPAGPARARPADALASALPPQAPPAKAVPVDPARVGSACRGLIEKIAAVPKGTGWAGLYREFNSACPGIGYDCVEYRSAPQRNQCTWVERVNSDVLKRSSYP